MFINILLKKEIRKVNKKEVPASHFVCAFLFKGRLKGIKKGAVKKQHLFCFFKNRGDRWSPIQRRKKFRVRMNFFEIHNKHSVSFSFSPKSSRFSGTPTEIIYSYSECLRYPCGFCGHLQVPYKENRQLKEEYHQHSY